MSSKKFVVFALAAFLVLVLSSGAFAGPYINVQGLSVHVRNNTLMFETDISNDGDEDCTLNSVEFTTFKVWENNRGSIEVTGWKTTGMNLYIKAGYYVHYTFTDKIQQSLPSNFDFYKPGWNFQASYSFKTESNNDGGDDDDGDDDDDDDDAF